MESSRDRGLDDIRDLVLAAAVVQGHPVDIDRVLVALTGAGRAFTRRRAAPERLPVAARRRRVHSLAKVLAGLEDQLHGLERDEVAVPREERDSLAVWGSREGFQAWRALVEGFRAAMERRLVRAARPARRGPCRDRAVRRLILDVAWTLSQDGLRVTSYQDGLLAEVAAVVALQAGQRLPEGRALERLLVPAVRFVRNDGRVSRAPTGNSAVTPPPSDFVRSSPRGR